ncbi:DUF1499 domain-containing protein [Aquisalimonas sp.]|uniref:DUF1499 domain-containing protein n=1 Tax=Aquisalimonas sp. TaxID=1872621 RepID=UPI0025BD7870|nr:DUF1499 domain-containing protein [Aquisalimonas sp.]
MKALGATIKLLLAITLLALLLVLGTIVRNWPPMFDAPGPVIRFGIYLTTNSVETRVYAARPELRPRLYAASPEATWQAAKRAVDELGWEILHADADTLTLQAVATTPVLRFQDDIYIQARAAEPDLSTVYFRSHSRMGRADLAANTRHLLNFRRTLEQELLR